MQIYNTSVTAAQHKTAHSRYPAAIFHTRSRLQICIPQPPGPLAALRPSVAGPTNRAAAPFPPKSVAPPPVEIPRATVTFFVEVRRAAAAPASPLLLAAAFPEPPPSSPELSPRHAAEGQKQGGIQGRAAPDVRLEVLT